MKEFQRIIVSLIAVMFALGVSSQTRDGEEKLNMQNVGHGTHNEYYIPADMPEVYFDSDEMEIIIVADGFANHYTVEVNSMVSGLTLIYTQIRGYGDTIDVSSLPDGYYQIIITSSNNNMFEGTFLIEKINRFLR